MHGRTSTSQLSPEPLRPCHAPSPPPPSGLPGLPCFPRPRGYVPPRGPSPARHPPCHTAGRLSALDSPPARVPVSRRPLCEKGTAPAALDKTFYLRGGCRWPARAPPQRPGVEGLQPPPRAARSRRRLAGRERGREGAETGGLKARRRSRRAPRRFPPPRRYGNAVRRAARPGAVMAEPSAAVSDPGGCRSGPSPPHGAEAPFLSFSLGAALAAGSWRFRPPSAPGPRGAWQAGAAAAGRRAAVPAQRGWRGPAARLQVTAGKREGEGRREEGRRGMRGPVCMCVPLGPVRALLPCACAVSSGGDARPIAFHPAGPGRSHGPVEQSWRGPPGSSAWLL